MGNASSYFPPELAGIRWPLQCRAVGAPAVRIGWNSRAFRQWYLHRFVDVTVAECVSSKGISSPDKPPGRWTKLLPSLWVFVSSSDLGWGGVGGVDIRHFNQEVFLTFFILGLVTAEQAAIFTNSVLQLARLQSASLDWELARVWKQFCIFSTNVLCPGQSVRDSATKDVTRVRFYFLPSRLPSC